MNKTKDDLIKSLKEVATGFDDELEAYCAECGAKQKDSWSVYCPFCGKDGTDPKSAVWKYR